MSTVNEKMTAIADNIRSYTGDAEKLSLDDMAENIEKVYEAGQKSMVDESKIIEATATGYGSVSVNDVSEVPHKITAKLSSVVGEISSLYTANAINTELEFPQKYGICPILSVDKENRIIHSFYVSSDEWNVPTDIYVTDDFDLELLDGAIGVYCYAEWDYYPDFVIDGFAFQIIYPVTLSVTDGNGNSQIYTPTANAFFNNELWVSNCIGIIENIGSASPNMIFSADKEEVEVTVDYNKSWGMQEEWDRFWEELQSGGSAMNYYYAFCYDRFNDKNFNPKYPIRCTNGVTTSRSIFYYNRVLTDTKVEIIVSSNNMHYCFQNASALKTVRKLTVKETTTYTDAFTGCEELENITFSGTIGQNISFASSSKLTEESIDNIIEHLKDLTGATSKTITVHANVYDRMVERGVDALVTAKNWSLAEAL